MKIGYPCINRSLGCSANKNFKLKSYSEQRLIETVQGNLDCLIKILEYNLSNGILFFRITSDIVPFASHPVCRYNWQKHFHKQFKSIGTFILGNNIRVSMHPDQFTLLNSKENDIFYRSVRELEYHSDVLDLMELGKDAKIQIHVGGVYGNKDESIQRFVDRYKTLDVRIKNRLVIENDDRNYNLSDCLHINSVTGIPVLFDVFHHGINSSGEELNSALELSSKTWSKADGLLMIDYSSQKSEAPKGTHAWSINVSDFRKFLKATHGHDFDIMLEIKDKEKSAIKAVKTAQKDSRFIRQT